MEKICTSCKSRIVNVEGATSFKCPKCAEEVIFRCAHCRQIASKYICSKCKFTGPN